MGGGSNPGGSAYSPGDAYVIPTYLRGREGEDRSGGQADRDQQHVQNPMNDRISRDEMMLRIAAVVSLRGTCERASVGAVIALEGRIISTGYVGAPRGAAHCTSVGCDLGTHNGCTRTVHAESNAIAFAAANGIATRGAELFCTHSPCRECAKLIANAGITRVAYEQEYRDTTGIELLRSVGIPVDQC